MTPRLQLLYNNLTSETFPEFAAEYIKSQCPNRKRLQVSDAVTHEKKYVYVPCGHCAVCRSHRIADWVSRMAIHTQYCRKYVYFITLTYSTFRNYADIPACLRDAYWRLDADNKTHHLAYSPCLLRHEHFQRYMKYLRKALAPEQIDFFMCGEMGSTYGRPHFHALVWSDTPITPQQFSHAWRVNVSKSRKCPRMLPIGNVRVDDLQTNGTLNHGNGRNAFRYVAKYCSKSFLEKDAMQKTRYKYFMSDLMHGLISDETLRLIFNERVRSIKALVYDFARYIAPMLKALELCEIKELKRDLIEYPNGSDVKQWISKYLTTYEQEKKQRTDLSYYSEYWSEALSNDRVYQIIVSYYRHCDKKVLQSIFEPYCLSSKRYALGKMYAVAHLDRFARHDVRLPQACGDSLVFPRYFEKLTQRHVQRYFRLLPTLSLSGYKIVPLADEATCAPALSDVVGQNTHLPLSDSVYTPYGFGVSAISPSDYIRRSSHVIKDCSDGKRLIFVLTPEGLLLEHYAYDRHTKKYLYSHSSSVDEFYQILCKCCEAYVQYRIFGNYRLAEATQKYEQIIDRMRSVCKDYIEVLSEAATYRDAMYTILCDKNNALHKSNLLNE